MFHVSKSVFTSLLVVSSLFLVGCQKELTPPAQTFAEITKAKEVELTKEVTKVPASEVVQMMQDKKDFIIVDIREADEIKTMGKIDWKNQKNISRGLMEYRLPKSGLTVDDNIYVLCKTSGRSLMAAKTLKEYGFKNVKVIEGGFDNWLEKKYPALD